MDLQKIVTYKKGGEYIAVYICVWLCYPYGEEEKGVNDFSRTSWDRSSPSADRPMRWLGRWWSHQSEASLQALGWSTCWSHSQPPGSRACRRDRGWSSGTMIGDENWNGNNWKEWIRMLWCLQVRHWLSSRWMLRWERKRWTKWSWNKDDKDCLL